MEDNDFYDLIYQQWSRTTGAEDRYWMPVEYDDPSGRNLVYAVGQDESRKRVASGLKTEDADFITAIHGCLPDLVRKLQEYMDEAERLDVEKDELLGRVADLEREVDRLNWQVDEYEGRIQRMEGEAREADSYVEGLSALVTALEKRNDGPYQK